MNIGSFTAFAAPSLTFGTANTAGDSGVAIDSNATILAFDTTVVSSLLPRATAATGSATTVSRRDHVHGLALTAEWVAMVEMFS